MPTETTNDRVIDEIVRICRDVRGGNQIQGLWKVFNIMVQFIKTQANLIKEIDGKVRLMEIEMNRLKEDVRKLKGESTTVQ